MEVLSYRNIQHLIKQEPFFEIKEEPASFEIYEPSGFSSLQTFLGTACGTENSLDFHFSDDDSLKDESPAAFGLEQELEELNAKESQEHWDTYYLKRPNLKRCNDCRTKFKTRYSYVKHMQMFHPELYKCRFHQDHFFKKKTDLILHLIQEHKEAVRCTVCAKIFPNELDLQTHLLDQHEQKKVQKVKKPVLKKAKIECTFCGDFLKDIEKHWSIKHPENVAKCMQPKCTRFFLTEEELLGHIVCAHNKVFKCAHCSKIFSHNSTFSKHLVNKHKGKVGVKCPAWGCNCIFHNQFEMDQHCQEMHPLYSKCDLCRYLAPHPDIITQHKEIRHFFKLDGPALVEQKVYKRPPLIMVFYKCNVWGCENYFLNRTDLEEHLVSRHKGAFPCDICQNVFASNLELQDHVFDQHSYLERLNHSETKVTSFDLNDISES